MLSLNQALDLREFVRNHESRRALEEFITTQRLYYMQQAVSNLRSMNDPVARKFAAYDEAYAEMLANLDDFATKALQP